MLQVLPRDSDVLCTHPMFGPESGKDGWKDLSFMVLAEMEIESTPIDTKGFQKLVQVLRNLELAFETVKQQLDKRMNEELDPKLRMNETL
ncbi:arogenate dehydrogenase 1 chloroplastic [Phtheirospermum japonicum]|uniref:Arogenate dehydrogenase 1 chloroplastic n=1 Tax=Phtheirospermum japonicum TaxID=374723 RepID=A0A830D8Z9_9LAMI|nr:arogenate dehydrogenase 1 chloroplastic [Phtheirospermum japonicum]